MTDDLLGQRETDLLIITPGENGLDAVVLKRGPDWSKVRARQARVPLDTAEGLPENRMRDHDPEDMG